MTPLFSSATLMTIASDTLLMGYGAKQRFKSQNQLRLDKPAFYVTDFFLKDPSPWIQYTHWEEIKIEEFKKYFISSFSSSNLSWSITQETVFHQAFEELKQTFASSTLSKAVPYLFAHSNNPMTTSQLMRSLKKGLHYASHYPLYLYGHWDAKGGILGVTPEILFNRSASTLQTMALAGTCHKEQSEQEFKHNSKEQQEHQWVVDGIKEALSKWGQVITGSLQVLSLPHLNHLMTPIEMMLPETVAFEEIVKCLHPTPALGAFPKQIGMQWLTEYGERMERGIYGAPFGVYYPQKQISRCLVAIRNVQWNKQGMRIGAGCGIVKESQYQKEWNEINLKIKAIQHLLDL